MSSNTSNVLKAQQSRLPFIVLYLIATITSCCGVWLFLQTGDYSVNGLGAILLGLLVFYALLFYVGITFKIGQSVEITEAGIWSLSWSKGERLRIVPTLEKKLFRWTDLQRWEVHGTVIHLSGSQSKVAINTLLFADGNEVIEYINRITTTS